VADQELVTDPVELVGRDAGLDVTAHLGQGLSSDPPGDAHALDGLGVLDVGFAHPRGAPAHVLGPGDVLGHDALRRNTAGLEGGSHHLQV
jgi:hypothetical protein